METYREILEEVLIKRAKLRTLHLLEQGDRTRKGLEERLLQNGYPPEAVEAALAYVGSFHYVDDKRYAVNYIQNQKNRKGRARIMMELRNKGGSQEDIDYAFQETEEGAEYQRKDPGADPGKKEKGRERWKKRSGRGFTGFLCAGVFPPRIFYRYCGESAGEWTDTDGISCLDLSCTKGPLASWIRMVQFRKKRKLV